MSSPITSSEAQHAQSMLNRSCEGLMLHRQKPLLVLYYPPLANMSEDDVNDAYDALRNEGLTPENKLASLDVLIHSYGGDPSAGYRLAQLIRDFAKEVY